MAGRTSPWVEKKARMERERGVTLAQQLDARYHAPDAHRDRLPAPFEQ